MSLIESSAHKVASDRLLAARGSIFQAFDNLGCGIDHDEALEYLRGSPSFQVLDDRHRGLVAGLVLGFALVAVQSDREIRNLSRRHRLSFLFGGGDER